MFRVKPVPQFSMSVRPFLRSNDQCGILVASCAEVCRVYDKAAFGFKHYVAYEDWTAVEGDPVSSSSVRGSLSLWDVDLANQ